jgi:hypothetical protein
MREISKIELVGDTRTAWHRLPFTWRQDLLAFPFVTKASGHWIHIAPGHPPDYVLQALDRELRRLIGKSPDRVVHFTPDPPLARLKQGWGNPGTFKALSFGADVAEEETHLAEYFVATDTYRRAGAGEKSVIIGAKGTGKSAIMRALAELDSSDKRWHAIVITPETFATSVLQRFVDDSKGIDDEQEAFASAWIFTILFDVFKRTCQQASGGSKKALRRIEQFLLDHAQYKDSDLFTRFVHRLSRIEAVKVGPWELGVKTKELQRLYSMEDLYSLVPDLRTALNEDILVLIDELDKGWTNTDHSNHFIASLMRAAIRVQSLGLRIRVIAFLRSEIFDLVKGSLDHLDKLRSGIEHLQWSRNGLAALVVRRVAFSMGLATQEIDPDFVGTMFPDAIGGLAGFDYLLSRTTMRPREVLQFVRLAHQRAVTTGASAMTRQSLLWAAEEFSHWKREHLCSEYRLVMPRLREVLDSFQRKGPILSKAEVFAILGQYREEFGESAPAWVQAPAVEVLQRLFQIEFLGIERVAPASGSSILARFDFATTRPTATGRGAEQFLIHPAFWFALEIPDPG